MKSMKKWLVLVLAIAMLAGSGCTEKPVDPTEPVDTKPVETTAPTEAPTTAPTEPADPLEAFREEMAGTPYVFAVAYMGDTYADEKYYSALLQELSPSVCLPAGYHRREHCGSGWG